MRLNIDLCHPPFLNKTTAVGLLGIVGAWVLYSKGFETVHMAANQVLGGLGLIAGRDAVRKLLVLLQAIVDDQAKTGRP